ncbi:STAS domain-containing protein [Streptomyces sp. NPDC047869]|uniref:STAS domain-containing protein n=1 Tax=Streptomyces sp. NPDC047869 TaxID=3154709 RepID=UPI003453839E
MPTFDVHVSSHHNRVMLTVAGELDFDTCPRITQVTDTVSIRNRTLCLDLAGVSFMDASGLSLLQRLHRHTEAEGGTLELSGLQEQPRRILALTAADARGHVDAGSGATVKSPAPTARWGDEGVRSS